MQFSPGPSGLGNMLGSYACVPKVPREEKRRDCSIAILSLPSGERVLSHFLCLFLSGEHTCPIEN